MRNNERISLNFDTYFFFCVHVECMLTVCRKKILTF